MPKPQVETTYVPSRISYFRQACLTLGAIGLFAMLGCAGDTTTSPRTTVLDAVHGYWGITLNHQAVTMSTVAPYDTIRLVATPRNALGAPLTGAALDSVVTVYRLVDPSDTSITVTSDGFVQARYPHNGTLVQVRMTVQGITRADTVPFNITTVASPPRLTTLAVHVDPDSEPLTVGFFLGNTATVSVQLLDADGQVIPDVTVKLRVRDAALAKLQDAGDGTGMVLPALNRPGSTMLYAAATVYGVTMTDSAPFTILPPAGNQIVAQFATPRGSNTPVGYFTPQTDTLKLVVNPVLGTGVEIIFINPAQTSPIDVVFDDTTGVEGHLIEQLACGTMHGGNIPPFAPDTAASCFLDKIGYKLRFITAPGTYRYHSALYGTSGTIVVLP